MCLIFTSGSSDCAYIMNVQWCRKQIESEGARLIRNLFKPKKEIKIMVMTNFIKRCPPPPIPTPMMLILHNNLPVAPWGPQMVNKEIELN